MSVKILGGVARNYSLATPHTSDTRPTSVLLKRRLFDSIQDFTNKVFIDCCAGSGSVGFEALSRGAEKVYLIEKSKNAFRSITQNKNEIKRKFPNLGEVFAANQDMKKWFSSNKLLFTDSENEACLFFDPPYELTQLYEDFFQIIKELPFSGKVIVEACQQKTMSINSFEEKFGKADKVFKQGTSYFVIYDL